MFMHLEIELDGPVATIWMNRPDLHNAFDENLIAELTAACRALDDDDDVRVVVLAGRGRSFSAGADMNWMKDEAVAAWRDFGRSSGLPPATASTTTSTMPAPWPECCARSPR